MTIATYLEDFDSQIPAVQLLCGMHPAGASAVPWQFLSRDEALRLRGGRKDQVVLDEVLEDWLAANNHIEAKGVRHDFKPGDIAEAIRRLTEQPYDGLVRTNEQIYHLLTLGTAIDVTIDGDSKGRQLK